MEGVLEKLFESVPKVRILRLFMQNPDESFGLEEIGKRAKIKTRTAKSEILKLLKISLIARKTAIVKSEVKSKSRKKNRKIIYQTRKEKVFGLNHAFEFTKELGELVTKTSIASRKKLLRQIKSLGNVKLAVIAGTFSNNPNSRTDLLIVGDGIKRYRVEKFINTLESGLGKPLRYTLMDTKEFRYRLGMYDKFLRDILEYQHEKLINKMRVQ